MRSVTEPNLEQDFLSEEAESCTVAEAFSQITRSALDEQEEPRFLVRVCYLTQCGKKSYLPAAVLTLDDEII